MWSSGGRRPTAWAPPLRVVGRLTEIKGKGQEDEDGDRVGGHRRRAQGISEAWTGLRGGWRPAHAPKAAAVGGQGSEE